MMQPIWFEHSDGAAAGADRASSDLVYAEDRATVILVEVDGRLAS